MPSKTARRRRKRSSGAEPARSCGAARPCRIHRTDRAARLFRSTAVCCCRGFGWSRQSRSRYPRGPMGAPARRPDLRVVRRPPTTARKRSRNQPTRGVAGGSLDPPSRPGLGRGKTGLPHPGNGANRPLSASGRVVPGALLSSSADRSPPRRPDRNPSAATRSAQRPGWSRRLCRRFARPTAAASCVRCWRSLRRACSRRSPPRASPLSPIRAILISAYARARLRDRAAISTAPRSFISSARRAVRGPITSSAAMSCWRGRSLCTRRDSLCLIRRRCSPHREISRKEHCQRWCSPLVTAPIHPAAMPSLGCCGYWPAKHVAGMSSADTGLLLGAPAFWFCASLPRLKARHGSSPGPHSYGIGRFTMSLASDAAPLTVRYLGQDGVAELYRQQPSARNSPLPALVRPVLPALWDEKGLAAVPFLGHRREPGIVPPTAAYVPVKSLSGASFAVV